MKKNYYAKIDGKVTEQDIEAFKNGLDLGDFTTMPAVLKILSQGDCSEIFVEICEGKFHQVKRMFEAVGKKVTYLKRVSMGTLCLDEKLQPGEWRGLTDKELEGLKKGK